jgi:hypothetical protein
MKCYWAEVRDVDDPTQSGHCRVRLYNRQNNEKECPDDKLPWAMPMLPVTSASTAGEGIIPTGAIVGTRTLVCFTDDDHAQQYPIMMGNFGRAKVPSKGGVRSEPDEESGGKIAEADAAPDHLAGAAGSGRGIA